MSRCQQEPRSLTTEDSRCPHTAVRCRHPSYAGLAVFIVVQGLVTVIYFMTNTSHVTPRTVYGAVGVSRGVSQIGLGMTQHKPLRIFYNRVPKCGSTTFGKLTQVMAGFKNFTYAHSTNYLQYTIDETKQSQLCAKLNTVQVPTIYDRHMHFVECTRFKMEMPLYINIIRDPLERLVSWYYFRRFQSNYIAPLPDEAKQRSFDACVLGNYSECTEPNEVTFGFGYFQVIPFFCGQAAFCRTSSQKALDTAISNVELYYSVIGVVDQFEEFVEALEHVLPTYFGGALQTYKRTAKKKENVTRHKAKPTEKVRQIMRKKMEFEYNFYYYVKRRFDRLYKEIKAQGSRRSLTKAQGSRRSLTKAMA